MGGARAVHRGADCHCELLLVVPVKAYLVPFVIAFVVCAVIFLGLDFTIMKLQGLSLIYVP